MLGLQIRGQPSLLPSVRKEWLGKPLLYGIGTLLVMPLRTLHGVGRMFGAGRFLCNMTSVSSSLQIELVSILRYFIMLLFSLSANCYCNLIGLVDCEYHPES